MVTGRRILLLADDSPATQKVVSLTFADEGLEVVAVGDGGEAARRLEEGLTPDIVLADIFMPGLTGYELCERIKGDSRLGHVPVVLLVGSFEPFDITEARRVGADTVLTKPFQSIRELVSKVASLLGGSKPEAEAEAARPEAPPREEAAAAAPFNDIRMDDELIETRPAEKHEAPDVQPPAPAAPAADEDNYDPFAATMRGPFAPATPGADKGRDEQVFAEEPAPVFAEEQVQVIAEEQAPVAEESRVAQPAFAGHAAAGAVAAEDALLDLDIESPAAASEADDFILDLSDDEPPAPPFQKAAPVEATPAYVSEAAEVEAPAPDAAGAFAEAAHGESAQASGGEFAQEFYGGEVVAEVVAQEERQWFGGHAPGEVSSAPAGEMMDAAPPLEATSATRDFVEPEVVPAGEQAPAFVEAEFTDGSVEGDVARPPVGIVGGTVAGAEPVVEAEAAHESPFPPVPSTQGFEMGAARVGVEERVRPDQLSPEAIDAIARRVVELMSDKVVREIAWEVVPELAELLIKQKLEEDSRRQ